MIYKDSALKMGMSSNADIFSTSHVGARQTIAPISEVNGLGSIVSQSRVNQRQGVMVLPDFRHFFISNF